MSFTLKSNHEIIGTLTDVLEAGEHLEIVFSVQKKLAIPADAVSVDKLQNLIGKRVGLLHLDGDDYYVRKIMKK